MPANVQGSPYSQRFTFNGDLGYRYPNSLNLKPGSILHEKIRSQVFSRAEDSYRVIQARFASWNKIDETLTVYMPLDEEESRVKDEDDRKPVSIVVPYSFAQLETIVTYLVAAFGQDPIFRYEGVGPEDIGGAQLLELLIQNQANRFKYMIPLHVMFRDAIAYGIGAVAPFWRQVWGKKVIKQQETSFSMMGIPLRKKWITQTIDDVLYEGNDLTNIDPYRFLPDPNYGIQDIQKGEYICWLRTESMMDLLSEEKHGQEDYFNVKYLKELNSRRSTLFRDDDSSRDPYNTSRGRFATTEVYTKPTDLIECIIKVIPKEWGLPGDESNPDGEYPEKWHFTLAADQVVIRAKPLGLNHDMFPTCVCAPDFDGRTITPVSRLEVLYGLQESLNFLFNSHITNVRKAINDMFVVDPYLVNMNDLKDPRPGKLIRLRRSAWGRGTEGVVSQLKVVDVTQNNIADGQRVMDIMERVSAATTNMMGIMRPGSERRSAAEFEGTHQAAMSRLERIARVIGLQGLQDLGYMIASQTQQLLGTESYVKIAGQYEKTLAKIYGERVTNGRIGVGGLDLAIDYDTYIRDGSIPGGNFSRAWVEMFQAIGQSPVLSSKIDVFRLFMHIARSLGAKDVEKFELKVPPKGIPPVQAQVMPDEQVQRQVQAGNMVPMEGLMQ